MAIEAIARRLESSVVVTAGKIETFMSSIGLNPEEFDTPELLKNKRTYKLMPTGEYRHDKICKTIAKRIKSKPIHLNYGGLVVWVLPGQGIVEADEDIEEVRVSATKAKDLASLIIEIVDSNEEDDTNFKSFDVYTDKKKIVYQVYDEGGRVAAKRLFRQLLKTFNMTDWTVEFPRGHWGDARGPGVLMDARLLRIQT